MLVAFAVAGMWAALSVPTLAWGQNAPDFIGFIGDSLTLGAYGSGERPPQYMAATLAEDLPNQPITMDNEGIAGTASGDWLPGGTNYTTAVAAFGSTIADMSTAPAAKYVYLMLGTNDAKDPTPVPQAIYQANMLSIASGLTTLGYTVELNPSPYIPLNSTGWSAQGDTAIMGYTTALQSISNGSSILYGLPGFYGYTKTNASTIFGPVPPHLTDGGYQILGSDYWATEAVNNSLGNQHKYAVAYVNASDPAVAKDHFTPGTEVIEPAIVGDANLDGKVDFSDFLLLAASFNTPNTSWDQGNFNYGTSTNFGDFLLLAANFNNSTSLDAAEFESMDQFAIGNGYTMTANPDGDGFSFVSVPEPASASLLVIASVGMFTRRPRRRVG